MKSVKRKALNTMLTAFLRSSRKKPYKFRIMVSMTPTPLLYPLPHAISSTITSLERIRKNIFGNMHGSQYVIAASHKASDELATVLITCDPYDFASLLCCATAIDRCIHAYRRRLRRPTVVEDAIASTIAEQVRKQKGQSNVQSLPTADRTPHDNA